MEQPPIDNMQIAIRDLADRIAQFTGKGEVVETAVPGLALFRRHAPSEPMSAIYRPSVCVLAKGAKRVILGEDTYVYDATRYLVTSLHLPTVVQIVEASETKPCLGLRLSLDQREIAQLMVDSNLPAPHAQQSHRGMATGAVTQPLVNAFQRLVDLLGEERDIPILAPTIQREILYRLLVGEQGARLRLIATAGSASQQIGRALTWLQTNYTQPLRVDELAKMSSMSTSTFHHHFRSLTALSPLQYQKNLRLGEARRLMLTEQVDASNAAFKVGYESPSQFSREYRRLFGNPPLRDITSIRQAAVGDNV